MNTQHEQFITQYAEPVLRFCMSRMPAQDAPDLAQEILLHTWKALQHQNVRQPRAYLWRIAHNRYARWVKHKQPPALPDTLLKAYSDPFEEHLQATQEEHDVAFHALNALRDSYRSILVDHHIHGKSVEAVAQACGLPLGTVKWRLHAGREQMRTLYVERMSPMYDERLYTLHPLSAGSYGNMDPRAYFTRRLQQAIAWVAYKQPLTMEEIAQRTGVPSMFLHDELDHMTYGDALTKTGMQYATNARILRIQDRTALEPFLQSMTGQLAERCAVELERMAAPVQAIGFYGAQQPMAQLAYGLLPCLIRHAVMQALQAMNLHMPPQPYHADGSRGWYVLQELPTSDAASGFNFYANTRPDLGGALVKCWIDRYHTTSAINENVCAALAQCNPSTLIPVFPENAMADDVLARCVATGLVERINGGFALTFPVVQSNEEYSALHALVQTHAGHIMPLIRGCVEGIYQAFCACMPARLHDQIVPNITGYLSIFTGLVTFALEERGIMHAPAPEAAAVWYNPPYILEGS